MRPEHVRFTVEAVPRPALKPGCTLGKVNFSGHEAIVMANSLVRVTILPELGGRVIEFVLRASENNQYYVDREAIRRLPPRASWIDYGGYEENLGKWCGPFWSRPYQWKVLKQSRDEVTLLLWYESERHHLQRRMTLRRSTAEVKFELVYRHKYPL